MSAGQCLLGYGCEKAGACWVMMHGGPAMCGVTAAAAVHCLFFEPIQTAKAKLTADKENKADSQ